MHHDSKRVANGKLIIRAIEVYRIPRGATCQDAIRGQNGASVSTYFPYGPEVIVRITPSDLGIASGTTSPPPFEIYASDIYKELSE